MKLNNRRKYGDANHQPRHKFKFRVEDAKERQEYYDNLTIQQKIDKLDAKLGVAVGAVRQRARLAAQLEEQQTKAATKEQVEKKGKKDNA